MCGLTSVKSEKNDTPLVFLVKLARCSSFKQSSSVQLQQVTIGKDLTFDLYDQDVSAGNLQPPFGESSEKIDLNELLITNEIATFFCRVSGHSMEPHMRDGDRCDQRRNDGEAFVSS